MRTLLVLSMLVTLVLVGSVLSSDLQVRTTNSLTSMPLAFTENQGQWDEKVRFRADAGLATMWFTTEGAYCQFIRRTPGTEVEPLLSPLAAEPDRIETLTIKASFIGANIKPAMRGEDELEYKCNYFIGNDPAQWRTDIPNYSAIVYAEVYPGIDLKYYGNGKEMEYDFIVSPGADLTQIEIRYDGAESIRVNDEGELVVETEWGQVIERRPIVYQEQNGERVPLDGRYRLLVDNTFGFSAGREYNPELALVIDPVLSYSTYLGGSDYDYGTGIAVDSTGATYVTGNTYSTDFPTMSGYQETFQGGSWDGFVTKLTADGSGLVYSTYFGGNGQESGSGIVVDSTGAVYITGSTNSTDFPTESGYQETYQGGDYDAFVTKLSAGGSSLVYSTYLGGSSEDRCRGIAVDAVGAVYIAGYTSSADFPTESGYQETYQGGDYDAFVTKLNTGGNSLVYSTYLGGSIREESSGIAVDAVGAAYVTGSTFSADFPTESGYQETFQGVSDVFVTKLSIGGNSLVYSTYLGGSDGDTGYGIAVDASGAAYITGFVFSTDFPTENAYQATNNGGIMIPFDAFVTKLSASGTSLVYSTYLGGGASDVGYVITVDNTGAAYAVGGTNSTDFPTVNSCQTTHQGSLDGFVTKLSSAGNSLIYSTFMGGGAEDQVRDIAVNGFGVAYVTGYTESIDFPMLHPYEGTFQGGTRDIFVARLTSDVPVFNVAANYPAGSSPVSICSADLDGDDDNDLAVANYDADSISILLNNGDGTFAAPYGYQTLGGPVSICTADLDGDDDHDLAVANELADSVSVFLNNGNATFATPTIFNGGTSPVSICAGVFDLDGNIDLAVANYTVDSVTILINDGDAGFDHMTDGAVHYGTGTGPRSVFTADLDRDGDEDLAVANEDSDDVSILTNNGDATFADGVEYGAGDGPRSVCAADLDGDGDYDVAVANGESGDVSVLTNNGDATLDGAVNYGVGTGPRSVKAADLDGDGDKDLVAANNGSDDVCMLRNNGDATFEGAVDYGVGTGPREICLTDVDGDGDYDAATANAESDNVSILINLTDVPVICCANMGKFYHDDEPFSILDIDNFIEWLLREPDPPVPAYDCMEEVDVGGSGSEPGTLGDPGILVPDGLVSLLDVNDMIAYLLRGEYADLGTCP